MVPQGKFKTKQYELTKKMVFVLASADIALNNVVILLKRSLTKQ